MKKTDGAKKTKEVPEINVRAEAARLLTFDEKRVVSDDTTLPLAGVPLGRDLCVISVSTYQGRKSLDVRRYYLTDDDEWKPTSKGIRLPAPAVEDFLATMENGGLRAAILELVK